MSLSGLISGSYKLRKVNLEVFHRPAVFWKPLCKHDVYSLNVCYISTLGLEILFWGEGVLKLWVQFP